MAGKNTKSYGIVTLYNYFQIMIWSCLLCMLLYYATVLPSDKLVRLYNDNGNYRLLIIIA